jgi:hypothetical protein
MQVQTHTDRIIQGSAALSAEVENAVIGALGRLADHVTRVEVHLGDENAQRGGANDKRCVMEARIEGRQPSAVKHYAATVEQAIIGAAEKLARLIETTLEKMRSH